MPLTGQTISLRSEPEIAALRRASALADAALRHAVSTCRPGVTTLEIEHAARKVIEAAGAEPTFPGLIQQCSPPFPAAACISVNDEVAHGVPSTRVIAPGDLVTIDLGLRLDGWCADIATSIVAGIDDRSDARWALIDFARELLRVAAGLMSPGVRWSRIATELERRALAAGYAVITELVGHSIGRSPHEPPAAPAYWADYSGPDFALQAGMVLAIEPVLCLPRIPAWPAETARQRAPVHLARNGWTVRTSDGSLAAHEERMVLVTHRGGEVLTLI